jgi:hypothetical protein
MRWSTIWPTAASQAQRADQMQDQGDLDGAKVWRRILEAIDELRRVRREGEPLN